MDDVYYYGQDLDVDDVCVRVGSGGFTLLFGMFCVGCWLGFFSKPPPIAPPPLS